MADPLASLSTSTHDAKRIEQFLSEAIRVSGDDYLTTITSHLINAGGKRQRPKFTIAAAATALSDNQSVSDDVVRGGVAVELVQVGSLYHDDVLDEAQIRRQVDSVNARWGNLKAILAGDFLLAKASEIAAALGTDVAGLLATTIADLCRGQVAELQTLYNFERTEEQYFDSIKGKTASLFATSTKIGGIVGKLPQETIEKLTQFGNLYGIAFQIIDDILDITATEEQIGKPTGQDIVEGVYSLPVIYTLQSPNSKKLEKLLHKDIAPEEQSEALTILRNGTGISQALTKAQEYIEQAKQTVLSISSNEAAQALANTAEKLLHTVK